MFEHGLNRGHRRGMTHIDTTMFETSNSNTSHDSTGFLYPKHAHWYSSAKYSSGTHQMHGVHVCCHVSHQHVVVYVSILIWRTVVFKTQMLPCDMFLPMTHTGHSNQPTVINSSRQRSFCSQFATLGPASLELVCGWVCRQVKTVLKAGASL